MKQVEIFNVKIAAIDSSEFKSIVKGFLSGKGSKKIAKVNTEFLLRAKENTEFQSTLESFDINIADGKGVLWAAKYLSLPLRAKKFQISNFKFLIALEAICQMIYSGASLVFYPRYCKYPIPENIPGMDAMFSMLGAAEETGSSVYFLGAEEDANSRAVEEIQKKHPKLKVAGRRGGFWKKDNEIIEEINKSGAELLIVALGSPKQEYWIRDNISKLPAVKVAVGEGGTLDRVANPKEKAPGFMQKIGLEWLWRLFASKNRTGSGGRAKRVWRAVPVFIWEVVKWKVRSGDSSHNF